MTAKYFSETSVPIYQTMWHHMPDDSNLFTIVGTSNIIHCRKQLAVLNSLNYVYLLKPGTYASATYNLLQDYEQY
jgi:hypothetical protein